MVDYKVRKVNDFKWEILKDQKLGMRVPGIIYADSELLAHAEEEKTIEQVINVANLPGILRASYAMPDIHYGYGFPIGGVAALDINDGVISPGGVGFDISCGVRVLRTNLETSDLKDKLEELMYSLYGSVPKGVGSKGKIKLSKAEMDKLFTRGVNWAIKNGYGWEEDKYFTEENGCMDGANPDCVSRQAFDRGNDQVGSLGSGNHFLEIQKVSQIYDSKAANLMGLYEDQITIMIHSGSRGLGHQICGDYLKTMQRAPFADKFKLPDRQLACAPLNSSEGKRYFGAMVCAVNYAMVNRHCLAHWVRVVLESIFKKSAKNLDMGLIYDVSHNIAKIETHDVGGNSVRVCVHRKGATRAFGPQSPGIPEKYRQIGQPVIIPGDMGRYSYIMVGTEQAMRESFGSTCHGAGRVLSRAKAKKEISGSRLKQELFEKKGIIVLAQSLSGLAEEAPQAYKDVSKVVDIAHNAGLSKKVAKLEPLGVIKG
ncbi:MAG: RtcB family protein [Actinobacteria bacterium]|nr:RtcB family protein [Actinomycetota bacterium]